MSVFLYRKWRKTSDGPWTMPPVFTDTEMEQIANPYMRLMYSVCKGILGQPTIFYESSDVFVRKYELVSIAAAKQLKAFLEDEGPEEVKAFRQLTRSYAAAAGTTYVAEWKLTKTRDHVEP